MHRTLRGSGPAAAILAAAFALAVLASAPASAQERAGPYENRTAFAVGLRAGAWLGSDDPWPSGALSLDWRLEERFVIDATYMATSRPVVLCSGFDPGEEPDECDERKLIHAGTLGFRAELGSARLRPYLGVLGGVTRYYHQGAIFGVRGGARYPVDDRFSVLADAAFMILAEDDGAGDATSLMIGASFRL